jgi:hypothetical protein
MEPPRDDGKPPVDAPAPEAEREPLVVVSHEALFAERGGVRCDSCGVSVPSRSDDDDEGYDVPGEGIYVWTRGDQVRFEKAPLCADCASAIGVTALARWEIEEEEG